MTHDKILKALTETYMSGEDITILEIGVGRRALSTKAFLEGLLCRKLENLRKNVGKLFSIDINKKANGTPRHIETIPIRIAGLMGLEKEWTFIEEDSKKVEWKDEIDILFIDGDHSYEGVKADFEKYEPFVKKGGLILMHDVFPRKFGVYRFWREIKYPKIKLALDRPGLGIVQKV